MPDTVSELCKSNRFNCLLQFELTIVTQRKTSKYCSSFKHKQLDQKWMNESLKSSFARVLPASDCPLCLPPTPAISA